MSEIFTDVLKKANEADFLGLLKTMDKEERRKLVPTIKERTKYYHQYGDLGKGTYGYAKGTDIQRELLQYAAFVCMNKTDYEKTPYSIWMLDPYRCKKIIDWYVPEWFSQFVSQQASAEFIPSYLNYEWVMKLEELGHIKPTKELVAKILPQLIFTQNKDRSWYIDLKKLSENPLTLRNHIWYLFELDTHVHGAERYKNFGKDSSKEKIGWLEAFKQLVSDQVIDRSRVLKESLLASNRNFNMPLSGWFAQLFTELTASPHEILALQKELIGMLQSPHSKPVNTALRAIQTIVAEKDFNPLSFLESVPLLISSDVKSTTVSTLRLLEKISINHPGMRDRITRLILPCFIQPDDEIQTRAAKIISKNGNLADRDLRAELAALYPTMLMNGRNILEKYFDEFAESKAAAIPTNEHQEKLSEQADPESKNPVPFPQTIDDLIFLASQAFDNNEPWHFDVLPAALLKFRSRLNNENIPLFEPAFQRAMANIQNFFRSNIGFLDNMLAHFFIDFGNWLIKSFPEATKSIVAVYHLYDSKEGEKKTSFLVSPQVGSYTLRWSVTGQIEFYNPFKILLLTVLEKIKAGDESPVLSLPTHVPCWIDPVILIDRLKIYQESGLEPYDMDLQIALSRTMLQDSNNALQKARIELTGELRNLMEFLLDPDATPLKPFTHKAAWMVASLTKKEKRAWPELAHLSYNRTALANRIGTQHWTSALESYMRPEYDYKRKKYIEVPDTWKILKIHREPNPVPKAGIRNLISSLFTKEENDPVMLYDFLPFSIKYLGAEHNDIRRILSLVPHNPAPLLADTINQSLRFPGFSGESDKRLVTAVLQFMYDNWSHSSQMINVFIGTCMLSSDKTVVNIAGEIWLKAVPKHSIDSADLGKVIGLHEKIEFAPLKRFTDLAQNNLFRVSPLHNNELFVLIENILPQLPAEPIKSLKKLLELYRELLGNAEVKSGLEKLPSQFEIWKSNSNLNQIILQIENMKRG